MSFFVWVMSAMIISAGMAGFMSALSGSFVLGVIFGVGASLIWLWGTGEQFLKD